MGHDTKIYRILPTPTHPSQKQSEKQSTAGTSTKNWQIACTMHVPRRRMDTLELKHITELAWRRKLKIILRVMSDKVWNKNVKVLQDNGFNKVIVKRELVDEADSIGKVGYMITVNRMLANKSSHCQDDVDTSFYTGTVEAMCMKEPLFDLIIGNVSGAIESRMIQIQSGSHWSFCGHRSASAERRNSKPVKEEEVMSKIPVHKEKLVRLQEEDSFLQKFKEAKGTETRKGYRIAYEKRGEFWYLILQQKDEVGDIRKQILAPKLLRAKVMEVAHNSLFGGHLGARKTEGGIKTHFFWSGLHDDVTGFCRLCDVCQKTVSRGSVARALLRDMPLID